MVKVYNNNLWKTLRSLDQESDNAPLTVSLHESASFGHRERGLQTHGAVMVVNPYEIYAGFN